MKTFSSFFKTLTLSLILLATSVSAWGATAELKNGQYVYFDISSNTGWASDNAAMRFNWFWNTNDYCCWNNGTKIDGTNVYYATTQNAYTRGVQMLRMSSNYATQYNYSAMKTVSSRSSDNQNCVKLPTNGWDNCTLTWGTYVPPMNNVTIANNGTTITSGSGTQADPYIIAGGATVKVKATADLKVPDPSPSIRYKFSNDGGSSYNTESTTNTYTFTAAAYSTSAKTYTVMVSSRAAISTTYNTAKSSSKIYFKVPAQYTVTFNANGHGTAPSSQKVLHGAKAQEPTAPTAAGYTFGGWYKESGCTNKYDFNTAVTGNLILYAKWTQNTYSYTVTAGEGGTVSPASGTVAQGSGVTIEATPNDGYEFVEWTATNGTLADASSASTTFTPSANNANATASFKVAGCTQTPTTPTSLTAQVDGNALAGEVCSGRSVTLTAGGTISVGSLQWGTGTVGENIIDAENGRPSITVSPTVTTTYWVRSIITEAGVCYGATSSAKTLQINITPALVQPVLSKSTLTLEEGGSTGSITVTSGTTGGTWTSSDPDVATVNNGTVTPKGPGAATITYSVSNGCEEDKTATCTVTVNAKPYYIGGRFQQKWNDGSSTTNPFTYAGNGRYKLETGKTVAELSAQITESYGDRDQFFFIHTGKGKAGTSTYPFWTTKNEDGSGHNFETHIGESNAIELGRQETNWGSIVENRLMKFTDATDNSSDVVIWWEPSTNKLWYTATANLTTNLYLLGLGSSNWTVNDSRRFVKDENNPTKAKVTITLAKGEYTEDTNDGFKINDNVAGKWYGNNGTMTRSSCTGWSFEDGKHNAGLTADVAGDYVFTLDLTNMKLSVTYPEAYKVTFSKGTGGKTVTATVDGVAITSGDYVLKGKSVVFTQEAETGYTFSKWTNGSSTTLSTDPSYTCTVTADVTVKAEFTENTTNVTIDANDRSLGTLKVSGAAQNWGYSTSVGVATTKSIAATPKDNSYEFTGWTLTGNVTTSDNTKNTTITIKGNGNSGSGTVTANFQKIVRTITFDQEGGAGGTETLNATYGEVATPITPPTKTGYIFGGYWTGDNGTVTQIVNTDGTWIANKANFTDANNKWIVTSDKTLYAKWEEIKYNLSTRNDYDHGTPDYAAPTKSKNQIGVSTTATVTASNTLKGYTFVGWNLANCVRIDGGAATATSIIVRYDGNGGEAVVVAKYEEDLTSNYVVRGGAKFGDTWEKDNNKMTKLSGRSYEDIVYFTVEIDATNLGNSNVAFQFKIYDTSNTPNKWWGFNTNDRYYNYNTGERGMETPGANIELRAKTVGSYTIKVDYRDPNNLKLTVNFPSSDLYIVGFNDDWDTKPENKFTEIDGIATISKLIPAGDHQFKLKDGNGGWRTMSATPRTITRSNHTADFSDFSGGDGTNTTLKADVAGVYTFTYNIATNEFNVTYPALVTLSDGVSEAVSSSQTSSILTSVPGQMVTATPTMDIGANGNTLCWKLYDKGQDIDHLETTVDINFISLGNGKITFELPKVTGTYYLQLSIHAGADCSDETLIETIICPINVSTENTVFFQDESGKWKNVYVYFYGEGGYWDDAFGSGATNITSHKMTRINGTNIFYYNYGNITTYKYIAFTDHNEAGNQWFDQCQVVYRGDFNNCVPLYVMDYNGGKDYRNQHDGKQTCYYRDGYWTTYMGTSSGYWLHIDGNGVADPSHEMTTTTVGKRVYTHKVSLNGNQTPYNLWFGGCNSTNYGVESNMTVTNCTEWNLYSGSASVNLYATASGDYTFILYCNPDGHFQLSVEFPVAKGDFQLVYDDGQQTPHPSDYIRSSAIDGKSDTVSMYIRGENGTGKTLKVQRCTGFSNNGNPQWETLTTYNNADFSGLNLTKDTVYNFHMKQTVSGNTKTIAIEGTEFYSGKYYVRTKAADGGWDAYTTEADNQMTYTEYSSHLPFDPYTHYFCKWVDDSNKDDVSYTVACDYAKALCDTLEGDNYTTTPESHALPEKANVRFTYDNRTNGLKRAYLTGASDSDFDDFLKLTKTKDGTTMKPGKNASDVSHVKLQDEENWVYATEIYVTSAGSDGGGYSFDAMLTAVYPKSNVSNPEKKQYFFAKKNNDGTYAGETLIAGTDGSEQLVTIRYDFKTNRLMRAWKPSGDIDDVELPLSADILLIREGQNAAEQLVFSDPAKNKITNVKTIFGALEFKYNNMVGKLGTGDWNHTSYRYCRYYVSFPFDVRISEIFGAGNYGEDYIIQKYNGTKRAEIGWFAETETFWETMDKSEKLNKYEGYCVMLNRTPFNDGNSHVWKNKKSGSSVYLYFPSASHKDDWTINATGDVVIAIPEHKCNIDRYFTQDVQNGEPYPRNHKNTDSHWNMVGTPLFQNATAAKIADGPKVEVSDEHPEKGTRLQYVYDWVNTADIPNGTAARKAWGTDFEFKAMHSYLIQYAGQVTFQGSHIANHVPAAIAARRVAEEVKNYTVELQLDRDSAFASRTYVELQENAEDGFLLNEDMYMGSSSPIANLYTYAGAYDVAANVLSVNSHIVPVGVQVKQAGTYTFSMTTPFDGTVTLIDYHTGARTNLGWIDYTITLEKGTINNRFALEINIQHVSTDVEGNTGNFKCKENVKFLHNGILYIKSGDAIYDARGSKVSMSYEL